MKVKVGTRGSQLALTQTNLVIKELQLADPSIEVEICIIKTKGDLILDRSLDKIGDKGLFVDEIEDQLRRGNIDIAIHSMKDLPTQDTDEFMIIPVLEREEPGDVLITRHKIDSIRQLPTGSVIGTGSKRRSVQIQALIGDVTIAPIRGNVETRIRKMLEQGMDGIILAAAGINRLGIQSKDEYTILPFAIEDMIPAPAQGVLACQILKENTRVIALIEKLVHRPTLCAATVERTFLSAVNGGCHLPLGAYLDLKGTENRFYYLFGDESCTQIVKGSIVIAKSDSEESSFERLIELAIECAGKAMAEVQQ